MESNKKIILSVIIPVYNVESYLEECVQSVLDQDLETEDFEVILINDGSTDSSLDICEKLCEKNNNFILINQSNAGLSAARNRGIDVANGLYLYFIDSDDFLNTGYLNTILNAAVQSDLDFIGFDNIRTPERYEKSNADEILVLDDYELGIDLINQFNFNNGVWWYIFKKESLGALRFKEGRFCEDGIFTAELLQNVKKARIIKNVVYNYYVNANSIVNNKDTVKNNKIIEDMFFVTYYFNHIINQLPKNTSLYTAAFRRLRERQESYVFYAFIRLLKLSKNYEEFSKHIKFINSGTFKTYPMTYFKDYNSISYKLLVFIFNNRFLLKCFINLNKRLKLIR